MAIVDHLEVLKDCSAAVQACGWPQFVALINEIIQFIFFLTSIIATLSIAYAGWLFLTSGDSESNRTKAKGIMWNTIVGIIIIFTGWIVVQFILVNLGVISGYSLLT